MVARVDHMKVDTSTNAHCKLLLSVAALTVCAGKVGSVGNSVGRGASGAIGVPTGGASVGNTGATGGTRGGIVGSTCGGTGNAGGSVAGRAGGSVMTGCVATGSVATGSVTAGSVAAGSVATGSVAAGSVAAGSVAGIGTGATGAGSVGGAAAGSVAIGATVAAACVGSVGSSGIPEALVIRQGGAWLELHCRPAATVAIVLHSFGLLKSLEQLVQLSPPSRRATQQHARHHRILSVICAQDDIRGSLARIEARMISQSYIQVQDDYSDFVCMLRKENVQSLLEVSRDGAADDTTVVRKASAAPRGRHACSDCKKIYI
jgi:hypothetical protein